MNETRSIRVSRRALSLAAAGGLALAGSITLVTGPAAQAQVMEQGDKVWVCKFVGKPFASERLKGGKNPIEVGWQSADKDKDGKVNIGDEFADGQGQSVVVQINGEDPGVEACMAAPPPTTTTGTTTSPGTTTTTTTPATTTSTPVTTTTTGGAGGGVAPGVGAPDTGGTSGGTGPVGGIIGGGLLLAAGGVLAGEAVRRRRERTEE
jgi:hypothetical protein